MDTDDDDDHDDHDDHADRGILPMVMCFGFLFSAQNSTKFEYEHF